MKDVTLKLLNETDDPKAFGGVHIGTVGNNQLWRFGGRFANRSHSAWDSDLERWSSVWGSMAPVPSGDGRKEAGR